MTNGNQLTREEQVWLVEYQVCHQQSRSIVSTHWTVVSIIIGVNTVLLGAIAYILSSSTYSHTQCIITAIGVAFTLIFICLCLWLNRINFLTERYEDRMKQIETRLGMIGHTICDNKEERKKRRCNIKFCPCIPRDGAVPVKAIYLIFSLLWILAIVASFNFDC